MLGTDRGRERDSAWIAAVDRQIGESGIGRAAPQHPSDAQHGLDLALAGEVDRRVPEHGVALLGVLAGVREPRAYERVGVREARRGGQAHARHVAADVVLEVPDDRDAIRCLDKEPFGQMPPVDVLANPQTLFEVIGVKRPDRVDSEPGIALPAETPLRHRVVHQVGHVDHEQWLVVGGVLVEVIDNPAAQEALKLEVAQPQIYQQRLAHKLVQGHPVAKRLGDCQVAQLLIGGRTQQLRGRGPGDRRDAQRGHPHVSQLSVGQPVDQRAQYLRSPQVVRTPAGVGAGRLGGERQGERRTARPVHDRRYSLVAEPVGGQQGNGVSLGQPAQLKAGRQRLPAAREPTRIWFSSPGDDDERAVGQRRQQITAQVAVKSGHPLVGVDQYQRATVARALAQQPSGEGPAFV